MGTRGGVEFSPVAAAAPLPFTADVGMPVVCAAPTPALVGVVRAASSEGADIFRWINLGSKRGPVHGPVHGPLFIFEEKSSPLLGPVHASFRRSSPLVQSTF
jgi:hypothetical protein